MSQRGTGYDPGTTVDYQGGEKPEALAKAQARSLAPGPDPDNVKTSSTGLRLVINNDGSVEIDTPAPAARRNSRPDHFDENLAETELDVDLNRIAMDYLDGVAQDLISRSQFIANWNRGVDLLGLKIEDPSSTRGSRQSISKIKSGALLKACVRSQSLSRGQLLPATGPAKIQEIGGGSAQEDELARDMQDDFNYYLTDVAKEYYPDTDRALFWRGFGGSMFKKVYRCPLRRRPVSDAVQLDSFIVSEDATSLTNAIRKTLETQVSPVTMRRMQLEGGWRDIQLSTPMPTTNMMRRKALESAGIQPATTRPQDQTHTVYEGYWHMDPAEYGLNEPNAPEGLPLPYRVVIDKDSHQVLALHRNWKKGDDRFVERQSFVKYGLVPGLGFLDYGYLHLIGNQTRVLTAILQILIDHGMISNFPSGMKVRGVRTATNEINPSLGEWVEVDIGNLDDIRKALMGLPYAPIDPSLIKLFEIVAAEVEQMGGVIEIETGGTKANVPVGTILAAIEQQSQDLTAVHERDFRSQKEELIMLRDLFVENPEDLRWMCRKNGRDWTQLVDEFTNANLVPASDPNIPSQTHRIMINQFISELAKSAPVLFIGHEHDVGVRVLKSVGVNDADSLLATQAEISQAMAAQNQPKGGGGNSAAAQASIQKTQMMLPIEQAKVANDAKQIQIDQQQLEREAANEAADHQQRDEHHQAETALDQAKLEQAERQMQSDQANAAPDAQDMADLQKTRAQAFSAVGAGAMGFAKAQQTVQQGEQETDQVEDEDDAPEAQPASKRLRGSAARRNKNTPNKG